MLYNRNFSSSSNSNRLNARHIKLISNSRNFRLVSNRIIFRTTLPFSFLTKLPDLLSNVTILHLSSVIPLAIKSGSAFSAYFQLATEEGL